jgi:hypothetical protein
MTEKSPELRESLSPIAAANLKARMMAYPHWSAEETAVYLGVSRQRLNEMVSARMLRRIPGVSKSGMFRRDEVLRLLDMAGAA